MIMKSFLALVLIGFFYAGNILADLTESCFKVPSQTTDPNAFQARLIGRLEARNFDGKRFSVLVLKSPICVEGINLQSGESFRYPSVNEVQLWSGLTEVNDSDKKFEVEVLANIYTREVHPRGHSSSIVLPVFAHSKGILWDSEKSQ